MTVQKKAGRKPARKAKKTAPASPQPVILDESDALALDQFCQTVQTEDISFESWESSHKDLDLTIPVWLTAAESAAGCERQIKFSRTIHSATVSPPQRQPASCTVSIPPGRASGHKLVVKGQGDATPTQTGDLIVIVYLKC